MFIYLWLYLESLCLFHPALLPQRTTLFLLAAKSANEELPEQLSQAQAGPWHSGDLTHLAEPRETCQTKDVGNEVWQAHAG